MRYRDFSIFRKLLLLLTTTGLLVALGSGIAHYIFAARLIKDSVENQMQTAFQAFLSYYDKTYEIPVLGDLRLLESSRVVDNFLISMGNDRYLTRPDVERLFLAVTSANRRLYSSLRLVSADGMEEIVISGSKRLRNYASVRPPPHEDDLRLRIAALYSELAKMQPGRILADRPIEHADKTYSLLVGITKTEPEIGGFGGVIIAHVQLTDYMHYLSHYKVFGQSMAWVFDKTGKVLLKPAANDYSLNPAPYLFAQANVPDGALIISPEEQTESSELRKFRIALSMPPELFSAQLRGAGFITLMVLIAIAFCSSIIALVFARQIARPITALSEATTAVAQGNLDTQVPAKWGGELGRLAVAFNHMIRGLNENIKGRIKIQHELQRAKEAAEAANKTKSQFLATMSHELRTPINGVLGNTELLLNAKQSPSKRRECLETIYRSANDLLMLINDILDISTIEAGGLSLISAPLELHTLIKDVVNRFTDKAKDKGLKLIVTDHPDLPLHVMGDARRIKQVLSNMLDNAIKFTAQGQISIATDCNPASTRDLVLRFEISDTGIGVNRDKLESIFNKFTQVDSSSRRRYGGVGLGLAICKQLVDMMGGDIGVRSQAGKGSTFWFTVPVTAAPLTTDNAAKDTGLNGIRALIVCDVARTRNWMQAQLTNWGMLADQTELSEQALVLLRSAHAAGTPYQITIMAPEHSNGDIAMLASKIHSDSAPHRTTLVVIAPLNVQQRMEPVDAGKVFFLTPPFKSAALKSLMQNVCDHQKHGTEVNEATQLMTKTRALLVEDDHLNQITIKLMLEELGCQVDVATNGMEAVDKIDTSYDIVFMDVSMPKMDGYEASVRIRQRLTKAQNLPIIAITARAMPNDRDRCLAAGMDDYLSKPIRLSELAHTLKHWCHKPQIGQK